MLEKLMTHPYGGKIGSQRNSQNKRQIWECQRIPNINTIGMGEFRKEERIKEGPGQSPGEIWFNWWVEEKEVVKKS